MRRTGRSYCSPTPLPESAVGFVVLSPGFKGVEGRENLGRVESWHLDVGDTDNRLTIIDFQDDFRAKSREGLDRALPGALRGTKHVFATRILPNRVSREPNSGAYRRRTREKTAVGGDWSYKRSSRHDVFGKKKNDPVAKRTRYGPLLRSCAFKRFFTTIYSTRHLNLLNTISFALKKNFKFSSLISVAKSYKLIKNSTREYCFRSSCSRRRKIKFWKFKHDVDVMWSSFLLAFENRTKTNTPTTHTDECQCFVKLQNQETRITLLNLCLQSLVFVRRLRFKRYQSFRNVFWNGKNEVDRVLPTFHSTRGIRLRPSVEKDKTVK